MKPTEHELTEACNAGAKAAYLRSFGDEEADVPWERLPLMTQHAWRSAVTPVIFPALQALPDRLAELAALVRNSEEAGEPGMPLTVLQTLVRGYE